MPPVLGPRSSSKTVLWSCAASRGTAIWSLDEREERRLLAVHELLDDDGRAGGAELAPLHALGDRRVGLLQAGADDRALARGQPVGLDHQRRAQLAAVATGGGGIVERREARGRHAVSGHQRLGEGLGALDGAPRPRPARRRSSPAARRRSASPATSGASGPTTTRSTPWPVANATSPSRIVDHEVQAARVARDARVAGRGPQMLEQRALRDLPGQRVLATAGADQQDSHRSAPQSF